MSEERQRSVYAKFPGDLPIEKIIEAIAAAPGCPEHVVHFAKIGEDDATGPAELRVITPLGDIDQMEMGCCQAVHWHEGTVVHLYCGISVERDLCAAITNAGGEHLGS